MHYHLIGICGTAMASLAGMLQARGHRVTGSDENVYPPMSHLLAGLGIEIMPGYNAAHLTPPPDCVVVGNAIPRGNPEVEEMLNRRLVYHSLPEIVKEEFIRGRRSLVVAGTHGKTSTASLAAWVTDQGGLNPGFLIGGVARNFDASFRAAESDYFIIEGDEYDTAYFDKGPKFMHYLPEMAIVTNIEYDHADIYPSLEAVKLAFRRFMNTVPGDGRLVAGWDSPHVRALVAELGDKLFTRLETFGSGTGVSPVDHGQDAHATWQARDIVYSGEMMGFSVFREGRKWGEFKTPLIGEFNVRNCLAVIVAADAWGIGREAIGGALQTFKGVSRRCEARGEVNGVTVIDDFAHHPTAVRETLTALRAKFPEHRLVAVFEPRSWSSRLAVFQQEYVDAFAPADYVVVAGVFDTKKTLEKGRALDTAKLIKEIAAQGKPAFAIGEVDRIVGHLTPELRAGDIVAIMSNGGFGGIHGKLLKALAQT